MKKITFLFIFILLFQNMTLAANQCVRLFKNNQINLIDLIDTTKLSVTQINTLNEALKADEHFAGFLRLLDLRRWYNQALHFGLSENAKKELTKHSYSNAFENNKEANSNSLGKVEVNAAIKAERIRFEIEAIQTTSAEVYKSQIQSILNELLPTFIKFEGDFIRVQKLGADILEQLAIVESVNSKESEILYNQENDKLKQLMREKFIFDKELGENYHQYIAYRSILSDLRKSDNEVTRRLTHVIQATINHTVASKIPGKGFKYATYTDAEINKYLDTTGVANFSRLLQDRDAELLLRIKLFLINPTVVKLAKLGILRLPEDISWGGKVLVGARDFALAGFEMGYNLHLKSAYGEDIIKVVQMRTAQGMYEKLKSINQEGEDLNGLLVIFARVTEHTDYWQKILDYADSSETGIPNDQKFVAALHAADIEAKKLKPFEFYYSQSNGTKAGAFFGTLGYLTYNYHGAIMSHLHSIMQSWPF